MGYQFATVTLGPLLLLQGRHVRRVTPRLPEPPGPRSGIAGIGPPLRVLIAGDSAAAGVGAGTQEEALSGRLAAVLSRDFRLSWKLAATTGHGAREVLQDLAALPQESFDVAITSTGVNDVTGGTAPKAWMALQERLVALLQSKFSVRQVLLSSVPPMHLFPALPQPLRWYLGQRAFRLNRALSAFSAQREGCEFVSLDFEDSLQMVAPDGFHPGPAGHAAWAERLADRIRRRWHEPAQINVETTTP